MVSQRTIEIVKATAPIIEERGEEITQRMYQITFEEQPDYKRGFENTWMQHLDGGGQAHKLAAAVYAYATHIDRLDELAKAVDHIAHVSRLSVAADLNRHVSLHIYSDRHSSFINLRLMNDEWRSQVVQSYYFSLCDLL